MTWGIINAVLALAVGVGMWWTRRKGTTPSADDPNDIEGLLRIIADVIGKLPHDAAVKSDLADGLFSALRGAKQAHLVRQLGGDASGMVAAAVATKAAAASTAAGTKSEWRAN